jgi:hypothetical protein
VCWGMLLIEVLGKSYENMSEETMAEKIGILHMATTSPTAAEWKSFSQMVLSSAQEWALSPAQMVQTTQPGPPSKTPTAPPSMVSSAKVISASSLRWDSGSCQKQDINPT